MKILDRVPLILSAILCFAAILLAKEKIYYADFEHMEISYYNTKYISFFNGSARRYSRRDPIHYVSAHIDTLVPLGNNVSVLWSVYEFLSNEYRRSFVEAHNSLCDFMLKDAFGKFIVEKLNDDFKTCPLPKAVYHVENISIPDMPLLSTFPFKKGRLYINWTLTNRGSKEKLAALHVDAVIKTRSG